MVDILLLEDDKVLSKEIRSFLLNQGFSCDQAFDGIEFLAKTHQKKEVMMPLYLLSSFRPTMI